MNRRRLAPDLQQIVDEEAPIPTLPGFTGLAAAADREMAEILREIRESRNG